MWNQLFILFFFENVKAIFTLVIKGECFTLLQGNEGRVRSGEVMTYVRMHEDSKNLFVGKTEIET